VSEYRKSIKDNKQSESIKWSSSLERHFQSKVSTKYHKNLIIQNVYRPFIKLFHYSDKIFNHRLTSNHYEMFGGNLKEANFLINLVDGSRLSLSILATNQITNLSLFSLDPIQSIPLYRYDENGNRIDNITDWALTQFQTHYQDPTITKDHIFHYTYAVLHHPAYRTKYEINLKREFPRLPFYANFHQWATWGKSLMDLHLNYETIEPYDLKRVDASSSSKSSRKQKKAENATIPGLEPPLPMGEGAGGEGKPPKAKLKAEKADGKIILDTETTLEGIPALAWDYKLGNRSALEWILDQYKEKTPKDPTIRELFNTYKFADYKEHVIDLLKRVCTVSLRTMEIIHQMPETVDHQTPKKP
jgi:predicted helicase